MFVLTVDQQGSRRVGDRVNALLRELAPLAGRDGVVRAKSRSRPVPLAVEGDAGDLARDAESVLTLLGAVITRRSPAGWAVIDTFEALGADATQERVAKHLGVSQQAVSQRLRAAMWAEGER